jgi:hypothetical protein
MSFELLVQVVAIFLTSAVVYVLTRPSSADNDRWAPFSDGEDGAPPELTGIQRYSDYHRRLHQQKSISFSSSLCDAPVVGSSSSFSSRASDESARLLGSGG